jgi:hypothetical protein
MEAWEVRTTRFAALTWGVDDMPRNRVLISLAGVVLLFGALPGCSSDGDGSTIVADVGVWIAPEAGEE